MGEMNIKRKHGSGLDWDTLLDEDDDHPPELIIMPSEPQDYEYQLKSDDDLKAMIAKFKTYIVTIGHSCKDNGDKLRVTLNRCEAEVNRRIKIRANKGGSKGEEAIQLSDQSDDGASCKKGSSKFASIFSKKINQTRTVNAFEEDMSYFRCGQGRKASQNGQLSNRGRFSQQSSSRSKPFQCATTLGGNRKHRISSSDKKGYPSLDRFFINRTRAPDQHKFSTKLKSTPDHGKPSTKLKSKPPSLYHLVDEDIEDPYVSNTTLCAEKLSDCMKDVRVYYPSSDDRYPVEVIYTDMKCLAPEAWLTSTIMNFYIRYLQQSSSENKTCNFHFFNTYFYNKLKKLSYQEDSFLKFRKWWKGVNIFEKAYIILPIHESAHWSLGIICIPTKDDESGPIVLHLDSLGLHDSSSIFDRIRRFVKEEWSYLRNSVDLPITDEIWENLENRIIDRKMQVPQQRNAYDCGLFVLYYMERFMQEAPERLTEKDLSMFGKQWFLPQEASDLRVRIHNLLVQEFNSAKDRETILSPKC